jgi:FMN hydrolase / 5-amino-6-(5-phospho-D-ribitylamino)uracil phosphatase
MKNIAAIRVISIDLFRTLAMVDDGYRTVWQAFLGDRFTPQLGKQYWDRTTEIVMAKLDAAAAAPEPFKTTAAIIEESYALSFKEIGLDYDPCRAAEKLFELHRLGRYFEDARPFLESAARHYRVCLSSDCDLRMLEGLEKLFVFDRVFASEAMRVYKAHPRFFGAVLDYYQLQPENILHIGDSRMDILTPGRLGLQTCWLERSGDLTWQYDLKPDFVVKSLWEVLDILKIK